MEKNVDLKYIKYHYGEDFARLCRKLFPTILENEGELTKIIKKSFNPSRELYYDIVDNSLEEDFKAFVFGAFDLRLEIVKTNKTPMELLDKAGYILYPECKTNEEILSFKPYYKSDEILCTFREQRLDSCRVWFAVKKDIEKIKRENFLKPERQDEYGTSVISIQFTRGDTNILSIKNRYNHKVDNPDATFGNNLDNIIPGLSYAFAKEYNLNIDYDRSNALDIPWYIRAKDGKFYKYNVEYDNIYFCANNVVVKDDEVVKFDNKDYVVFDKYLLDLKEKLLFIPWQSSNSNSNDAFTKSVGRIKDIKRQSTKKEDTIYLTPFKGGLIEIGLSKKSEIIRYINPNVKKIENDFLMENNSLQVLDLEKVTTIAEYFLNGNNALKIVNLPNVKTIGNSAFEYNSTIKSLDMPCLERVGDDFCRDNNVITNFNAPNLKRIGDRFFAENEDSLKYLNLPSVSDVGKCFLESNVSLEELNAPNLKNVYEKFLAHNNSIKSLCLPSLENVGSRFMPENTSLKKFEAPNLKRVNYMFLQNNDIVEWYKLPNLKFYGNNQLPSDNELRYNLLRPELMYKEEKKSENINLITKELLQKKGSISLDNDRDKGLQIVKDLLEEMVKSKDRLDNFNTDKSKKIIVEDNKNRYEKDNNSKLNNIKHYLEKENTILSRQSEQGDEQKEKDVINKIKKESAKKSSKNVTSENKNIKLGDCKKEKDECEIQEFER